MGVKELDKNATERQWLQVEKDIVKAGETITKCMKSVDDLVITLHLYSSYCRMMTRRLITAENDLKEAQDTFRRRKKIDPKLRPDIPVIPS